jgi:hypothetical protein
MAARPRCRRRGLLPRVVHRLTVPTCAGRSGRLAQAAEHPVIIACFSGDDWIPLLQLLEYVDARVTRTPQYRAVRVRASCAAGQERSQHACLGEVPHGSGVSASAYTRIRVCPGRWRAVVEHSSRRLGGSARRVTVEAASSALTEKTRTVVTDGSGQYRIIDLLPGRYTLTACCRASTPTGGKR